MNISEELKGLIPPLSASEKAQLEANCIADGIRDALIIARYPNEDGEAVEVLADGHNRYEIAERCDLQYKTEIKEFDSLSGVRLWMRKLQLGRRNLTDGWKWELAQGIREELLEKGKEKLSEAGGKGGRGNIKGMSFNDTPFEAHSTRTEVAETLNWSKGKTAQAEQVWKKAPEEIKQAVRDGDMTIGGAYKVVKKEDKIKAVREKEAAFSLELQSVSDFDIDIFNTDKKFNIILADPAWDYWSGGEKNQSLHYSTMSIDEICKLPVRDISADDCILFIWVTYPILQEAFNVISSWGFEYSTCGFVWVKSNKVSGTPFFGNGAWTRANSELCLIAKKGSITRLDASISQVITDPIQEHSQKPYRVRGELITKLVGDLPRIELFSRCEKEDGWFNWGNKI